jgi:hypothetical protein
MGVGTDDRVGIGPIFPLHLLDEDDTGQALEVDLVDDAGGRRHHLEKDPRRAEGDLAHGDIEWTPPRQGPHVLLGDCRPAPPNP